MVNGWDHRQSLSTRACHVNVIVFLFHLDNDQIMCGYFCEIFSWYQHIIDHVIKYLLFRKILVSYTFSFSTSLICFIIIFPWKYKPSPQPYWDGPKHASVYKVDHPYSGEHSIRMLQTIPIILGLESLDRQKSVSDYLGWHLPQQHSCPYLHSNRSGSPWQEGNCPWALGFLGQRGLFVLEKSAIPCSPRLRSDLG